MLEFIYSSDRVKKTHLIHTFQLRRFSAFHPSFIKRMHPNVPQLINSILMLANSATPLGGDLKSTRFNGISKNEWIACPPSCKFIVTISMAKPTGVHKTNGTPAHIMDIDNLPVIFLNGNPDPNVLLLSMVRIQFQKFINTIKHFSVLLIRSRAPSNGVKEASWHHFFIPRAVIR